VIGGTCGASGCIDVAAVAAIFGGLMFCWISGFGVGHAVAWIRKLRDVV